MYPHSIVILGRAISVWNLTFGCAVIIGYFVLHRCLRLGPRISSPLFRYLIIVYLSALSAQVFSYAFDVHGSFRPPPGISAANWYLNPIEGTKVLYGVIVAMPLVVAIATIGARIPLARALDLCTPAMFTVLAIARLGCFLQGCCYGIQSSLFGLSFPAGSPSYSEQVVAGLIRGADASLPVLPTQAIECVFLAAVAGATFLRLQRGAAPVFLLAVSAYSAFRFLIEFVRADLERGFWGPLTSSQWIAIVVLMFASGAMLLRGDHGAAGAGAGT